jgi:hypothetical protein
MRYDRGNAILARQERLSSRNWNAGRWNPRLSDETAGVGWVGKAAVRLLDPGPDLTRLLARLRDPHRGALAIAAAGGALLGDPTTEHPSRPGPR